MIKYPIKIEKKEARRLIITACVKQLKTILDQEVSSALDEKPEFVKKCEETEYLEM